MRVLFRTENLRRFFILLSGLWVGGFSAVGFVVAPVLFSALGDRQVAGMVAGHLFKIIASSSVSLSVVLMILANLLVGRGLQWFRLIRWILLVMLAFSFAEAFVIIPWMDSLRDEALGVGMSIMESSWAHLFMVLHQISSLIFIAQSILGVALIWRATQSEVFRGQS